MKNINQKISQSISCLLAISLLFISSISYADDALVIPKDSQWKFLAEKKSGKFTSMMYYSIAPRHKMYPANLAQVWLKEELLNCTQTTCGIISRQRVDCGRTPKGLIQEQEFAYNIKGQRVDTNSAEKSFLDVTGDAELVKLYNTTCTETSNERRLADARQQKEHAQAKAAVEKKFPTPKPSPYQVTLPLTSEPDGSGFVYANEAYFLFENGVQVAKGVTDSKGDIPYKLKKNASYIIQFVDGKYTLNPERRKKGVPIESMPNSIYVEPKNKKN